MVRDGKWLVATPKTTNCLLKKPPQLMVVGINVSFTTNSNDYMLTVYFPPFVLPCDMVLIIL